MKHCDNALSLEDESATDGVSRIRIPLTLAPGIDDAIAQDRAAVSAHLSRSAGLSMSAWSQW
jgi:hypothetical protein